MYIIILKSRKTNSHKWATEKILDIYSYCKKSENRHWNKFSMKTYQKDITTQNWWKLECNISNQIIKSKKVVHNVKRQYK